MITALWIIAVALGFLALAYVNASGKAWGAGIVVALVVSSALSALPLALNLLLTVMFIVLAIPLALPKLRRKLVSDGVLAAFRKLMPPMSQTEREALEAGTVWWDGDLFSGRPDWSKLLATPHPTLSAEEQRFLDDDTEKLCAMADDWEAANVQHDLPPDAWRFIEDHGFLGMIIPKEYGGLGFSALGALGSRRDALGALR